MSAVEGLVHPDITNTLSAFLEFCYIARQDILTNNYLNLLDAALKRLHQYREIFWVSSVRPAGFSLPRQHALNHYHRNIKNFRAPNGLCSSITKSKHISAVKKPWCRSNQYEALKQMLIVNTRNNQLAAARADFSSRGMLHGTCLSKAVRLWKDLNAGGDDADNQEDEDDSSGPDGNGEPGYDLDFDDGDKDEDDGSPGPVDGPPIFSEVVLAQNKGIIHHPYRS
jgi:hypothetical protein